MKRVLNAIISLLILLVTVGIPLYIYRAPLTSLWNNWYAQNYPCRRPIAYHLGIFDARFGISKEIFLKDIQIAEQIWEKPIGHELFAYRLNGEVTVNLIYDYRQEATVKLRALGFAVDENKNSYDALKVKYETLTKNVQPDKASLDERIKNFKTQNLAFNREVEKWNQQGGAPKYVYDTLQTEEARLKAESAAIKTAQTAYNTEVDSINALVLVLNRLGDALNMQVAHYNQVGAERGKEFEEGLYQSGPNGREIDIYQFDNNQKLIKVLAHELGHALGLNHNPNPKAIMYELNQGTNDKLTPDDVAALQQRCQISNATANSR